MEKCIICGKLGDELLCASCIAAGVESTEKFMKGPGKYIGVFAAGVYIGYKINKKRNSGKK
jgi:hypothetical protein